MASADPAHVLRGHTSDVQSLAFLSEEHLYSGDSNGELRLWDLASCRTEFAARLHDANTGILQLACLPAYGLLISQGRDGCVKLWAAGRAGALDRSQPLHEIRTDSFNFCRCAVWTPGGAAAGRASGGVPQAPGPRNATSSSSHGAAAGGLRDVLVACAAHDPADIGVWRPAEGPTARVLLRQGGPGSSGGGGGSETKHGMCMSLAFLAPCTASLPPSSSSQQQQQQQDDAPTPGCDAGGAPPPPLATSSQRAAEHRPAEGPAAASRPAAPAPGATAPDDGSERPSRSGANVEEQGRCRSGGEPGGGGALADPRFMVAGYEDGVVALWDLRSPGRPLGSLRVHREPVMSVDVRARSGELGRSREVGGGRDGTAVAPTGGTESYDLVSGSADDQVSCCVVRPSEARPLALERQLGLREAGTADVRIRLDGKLFACGCWDGAVRLFSLRRREPLAVLKYHRSQVAAVAFSPETNTLASASRDTTIALWSVFASPPASATHGLKQ